MRQSIISLCLTTMVLLSGCASILETITTSGDALKEDMFEVSDSLSSEISSLSTDLLDFLESNRMENLVDSVVQQASKSFVAGLNLESVLAEVDANIDNTLAGVLDSLLSEEVSSQLGARLKQVLEESGLHPEMIKQALLNEETTSYLLDLRDQMLDGRSPEALAELMMDGIMLSFSTAYDTTISRDIAELNANL